MFTKQQLAKWRSEGFDFNDSYDAMAVEEKKDDEKDSKKEILVAAVQGPDKIFSRNTFLFKVVQFNTNDFKIKDVVSKIRWGYSVDGGGIINISQKGREVPGKLEVQLNWKVPNLNGEKVKVYAWIKKPNKNIHASSTLVRFPFYFDRYKLKGLNASGTRIANDLCYGDGITKTSHFAYTKKEIEELGWLVEETMATTNTLLWLEFKLMVGTLFSIDELEKVAYKMVEKFKKSDGGEFTNPVLTSEVRKHESTKNFLAKIEEGMQKILKDSRGNIVRLNNNDVHFDVGEYGKPVFNTFNDTWLGGLRICINDTWAYEVIITNYESRDNINYKIDYKVILYDNFGLDKPDLEKTLYYSIGGFRSWFVLQHLRNFRPFITKIEFDKSFSGNINSIKSSIKK